jgi:hypothetical protein
MTDGYILKNYELSKFAFYVEIINVQMQPLMR